MATERNLRTGSFLLVFALVTLLLSACGASSTMKIGWAGSDGVNSTTARYLTFDGVERRQEALEAGATLILDYDVSVEKGALTIAVTNPDGEVVWERTAESDVGDTVNVAAEQSGKYTIALHGAETGGSYEVSWSVQ